jgi:hypothetical protein
LTLYKLAASLLRAYADAANELTETGYTDAEITTIKAEVEHFEKVRNEVKLASGDYILRRQWSWSGGVCTTGSAASRISRLLREHGG